MSGPTDWIHRYIKPYLYLYLFTEKPRQATTGPPDKLVARCHTPSGIHTQRAQITVGTNPAIDTHRCGIPARHRADVSSDGKSSEVRRQNPCTSYGPSDNGLCLAVSPRSPEFSNRCNPTRSIAPQTSAALSTGSLGAHVKELTGIDPSETRSVGPPSPLVVEQRVDEGRNTTRCTSGSDPSVYRRVRVGLGSPSRHMPSEWILVRERDSLHINHLELLAVYNALIAFRNQLTGVTVQLMSDNSTVVGVPDKSRRDSVTFAKCNNNIYTTHTRGSRSLHCIRWLRCHTQEKHSCSTLVEPH